MRRRPWVGPRKVPLSAAKRTVKRNDEKTKRPNDQPTTNNQQPTTIHHQPANKLKNSAPSDVNHLHAHKEIIDWNGF